MVRPSAGRAQLVRMTERTPPPALPDGPFVLLQLAETGPARLGNVATQECVILPPPPEGGEWHVAMDADGFAVCHAGATRRKAIDIFSRVLRLPAPGASALRVTVGQGPVQLLSDMFCQREHCELGVVLGEYSAEQQLDVLRFRFKNHGCLVWWSLYSIYTTAALEADGRPGKWVYHSITGWFKFLEKCGISPAVHLRRSQMKDRPNEADESDPALSVQSRRLHEFPAASTMAMIALLVRSSQEHHMGGMKAVSERRRMKGLLVSIFQRFRNRKVHIRIFDDGDAAWSPPCPPEGEAEFVLQAFDGGIRLADVEELCPRMFAAFVGSDTFEHCCGSISIADALESLFRCSYRNPSSYFKQLLWQVGMALDALIASEFDPWGEGVVDDSPDDAYMGGATDVPHSCLLHPSDDSWRQWRSRNFQLLKYLKGLQHNFADEPMVSMSVDISRVGGRSTMISAIAKPDGVAGWAPPQARRPGATSLPLSPGLRLPRIRRSGLRR